MFDAAVRFIVLRETIASPGEAIRGEDVNEEESSSFKIVATRVRCEGKITDLAADDGEG